MFKSAATKIAHNSTLPALAINQDLRPLQDLISAEKTVILSLQRLATDLSKASEALKAWGLGEGDDLGDVLTASTTILTHFTSALSQYASHGHYMREQLKAIRTREESLDELKRRRRSVNSKADAAEKKLHRMNPEHKNFVAQTELLNKLRDEIRGLDVDIMKDEAALGDFKRSTTRTWVGLKFGGLIECCEKGVIAGEYGKLVISEIPNEQTQPGLPRSPYFAHSRIGDLVAEAHRCVNEVRLSTVPSTSPPSQQLLPQVPHVSDSPFMTQGAFTPPQPRFAEDGRNWEQQPRLDSPVDSPISQHRYSHSLSNAGIPSSSSRRVDEFGNSIDNTGGSSRFATFPIKARSVSASGAEQQQYSLIATPPPLQDRRQSDSFSSSVAQALAATSVREPVESTTAVQPGRFSKDGPAPSYEASVDVEQTRRQSDHAVDDGVIEEEEEEEEEGDGRHVRFGRVDDIPDEEVESSGKALGQGPQARLTRLLQNEDEDRNHAEQSLDAAAARKVGLELTTDDQQPTTTAAYGSPPGSSPSSPVRTGGLERAPTYTEKPVLYHGVQQQQQQYSHGYYDSPQQQQQQQPPPGGSSDGYVDGRGKETADFYYNPYDEHQHQDKPPSLIPPLGFSPVSVAAQRNKPPAPPPPSQQQQQKAPAPAPPPSQQQQQKAPAPPPPPQKPSSPSPLRISVSSSMGDGEIRASPLDDRPPSAPYMSVAKGSNSSLNNLGSPGGGAGGGKISAAAFKRPAPRIGSPLSSTSLGGVLPLKVGGGAGNENNEERDGNEEGGEGEQQRGGDVGAGVGTYYYNGVGGLGQGKFES